MEREKRDNRTGETLDLPSRRPSQGTYALLLAGSEHGKAGKDRVRFTKNGGKGSLDYLVHHPAIGKGFKGVLGKDGKWIVRDDVWIWYLGLKGETDGRLRCQGRA